MEHLLETSGAEILKLEDEAYFNIGVQDIEREKELVVSNSLLKRLIERGIYDVTVLDKQSPISDTLQESFNIGSAVHCRILEPKEFEKRFYISDRVDPYHEGIQIKPKAFEFMKEVIRVIKLKYIELMDGEGAEYTITWKMNDVKCKLKADKIVYHTRGVDIYDVKTTHEDFFKLGTASNGDRWELRRLLQKLNYDLQAYFYTLGVEAWAREKGITGEVNFYFVFISTTTSDVQVFKVGERLHETGREKFNSIWWDIVDFVKFGKSAVNRELEI